MQINEKALEELLNKICIRNWKMNKYIELIDKKLDEFMPIESPENIFKSMKYTVTTLLKIPTKKGRCRRQRPFYLSESGIIPWSLRPELQPEPRREPQRQPQPWERPSWNDG